MTTTRMKVGSLVLAGLLLGQLSYARAVAAQNVLSVGSVSVSPGASVVIPINLTVDQNLTLLRFDVTFPSALCAMIADKNTDGVIDGVVVGSDGSIAADKDIVVKRAARVTKDSEEEVFQCSGGKISIAVFDLSGSSVVPSGSGGIFAIEFNLKSGIPAGSFTLTPANVQAKRGPLVVSAQTQSGDIVISGTPVCVPADCNDGNLCTQDQCVSGTCQHTLIVCNDGISCTVDSCNPASGCAITPDNGLCSDGDVCTQDICAAGSGCANPPVLPACGNGCQEAGEECDDGNTANGDGCSSTCKHEPTGCGNGQLDPGEECDDGNTQNGDNCSSTCKIETQVDHFKCYDAKTAAKTLKFDSRDVTLVDRFETKQTTVAKPTDLCNPVSKNGEVVHDPTAHLLCYQIKDVTTKPKQPKFAKRDVTAQDQFGSLTLTISTPGLMCAPSEKNDVDSALRLDHFKCYAAKTASKTPKFTPRDVTLADQFETKNTTVLKPVSLCVPVDKNSEGIRNTDTHLTCYDIKDVKGQDKFVKQRVTTKNQFGDLTLDISKSDSLCVPSTITDLGPSLAEPGDEEEEPTEDTEE